MYKNLMTALAAAALMLTACNGGASGDGRTGTLDRKVPELMAAVPSDALAVVVYDNCSQGLQLYDSTSVLHSVDLGDFANSRMALALCYNGKLSPVLALEAGKDAADSVSFVSDFLETAKADGLTAEYVSEDKIGSRGGAVVVTPSEAEMAAVRRHLGENTSILEAQDFREALNATGNADNFIILRTSGADRLIPKDFLSGTFNRSSLISFVKSIAEWIVLVPQGNGFTAIPVMPDSDTYYAKAMEAMPAGDSEAGKMLPDSTTLAIAMPVGDGFREAYEKYLDATVKLEKYSKNISGLKKQTGKDPLKWEKEIGVREVALARWDGRSVLLVRAAKAQEDKPSAENEYKGFVPALYGNAFAAVDDSFCAVSAGWYIFGSEQDVNEFILCDTRMKDSEWPGKACHCIIYEPQRGMTWNKKNIRLWNSSL